jgi:hypothetical protein
MAAGISRRGIDQGNSNSIVEAVRIQEEEQFLHQRKTVPSAER